MEDTRPVDLPEVLRFMSALWRIVHALETTSKRMAKHHGVTGPQRLVLRVIGLRPGLSAGALAGILHLHPSTLTGVLRRLVSQGLVTRTAHAGDRRRAVLQLTKRGRTANARRRGTVEAGVRTALGRVSDRHRASARAVLVTIAASLADPAGIRRR